MPDCILSNEAGDSITQVFLVRRYQPVPFPTPKHKQLKSDHQMISGPDGPGELVTQRAGWGPGRLTITLPIIEQSHLDGIKALYFSWISGRQARVRFTNGIQTWICEWDCDWDPEPLNFRRPLYKLVLTLLIKEVVV